MDVDGRNFGALHYNRLKSKNHLPQDRFGDLERSELVDRLDRLADVRSAVVARGRALIANPKYPDKTIVFRIGYLLAGHLRP